FSFSLPLLNMSCLKHVQCIFEELKTLVLVLKVAASSNLSMRDKKDNGFNIKRIELEVGGGDTKKTCEYENMTHKAVAFVRKWIGFCKSLYSTLH
uniref:Interleukin-2 n=1 Tax=Capra hircus TaxID=9925 RepID=A0A8C2S7R9_CAPHI